MNKFGKLIKSYMALNKIQLGKNIKTWIVNAQQYVINNEIKFNSKKKITEKSFQSFQYIKRKMKWQKRRKEALSYPNKQSK